MKWLLMAAGAAAALAAPGFAQAEAACADLKAVRLAHAEVTAATAETSGGVEICKVAVTSRPTADSDIRIEVWIPRGRAWNGKFIQIGNGGFAGQIRSAQLRALAVTGYAAAGTDNGHRSAVGASAAWALNHPEKVIDFGWRSLKETTDAGKALVAAQKADRPAKSYFVGCSDGGREALMEAQRFPGDFDGIVAGAPANYMSQLFANGAAQQQALARPGGYLAKPQLDLLQATVLKRCGGETFVRDPAACRFDPAALRCRPGEAGDQCLTAPQVASARAIYDGRRDPRTGRVHFPGITPGAEAEGGSFQAWITGPSQARNSAAASYQFASNAFKYMAFGDPAFDFLTLDLGAPTDRARARMSGAIDAASPDLRAFKARGGKLIQYHGWNDPAIPARSSIVYYEEVGRTMRRTDDFYRLYLVPGMLHCGGGPGPSNVDWVATLDRWVVGGAAPGEITATAAGDRSQLICPYPAVARRTGQAWRCVRGRPAA